MKPLRTHSEKLTRASEFKAVLAGPCRISEVHFLLRADSSALKVARLGLITSRKAARRAVDRNRGKRIAREAFRAAREGLPAVDVVVQQKNNLRDTGNRGLRLELDRLLGKLRGRFGTVKVASPAMANTTVVSADFKK